MINVKTVGMAVPNITQLNEARWDVREFQGCRVGRFSCRVERVGRVKVIKAI